MSFVFQDLEILKKAALWRPFEWRKFPRGRLIVWASYWINARAHGENATAWRCTDLAIHFFNALLVLSMGLKFSRAVAITSALLFFFHPLTTMCSSYVAGRASNLCGTIQLGSLALAVDGFWIAAFAVALVGALFVKEDALVVFPMLAALKFLA